MALSASQLATIDAAASRHGVPASVLRAVATQESGGNSTIVNPTPGSTATGLFQITAATAQDPGYGVAPIALADRTNDAASAEFAASYLAALKGRTGSWDAALQRYSGGNYGLGTLETKYPDLFASGGAGVTDDPFLQGNPMGDQGGTGTGTLQQPGDKGLKQSLADSLSTPFGAIWEVVSRSLLVVLGGAFIMLAMFAMFWSAKSDLVRTAEAETLPK